VTTVFFPDVAIAASLVALGDELELTHETAGLLLTPPVAESLRRKHEQEAIAASLVALGDELELTHETAGLLLTPPVAESLRRKHEQERKIRISTVLNRYWHYLLERAEGKTPTSRQTRGDDGFFALTLPIPL
jgi:hypothetical protein